VPSSCNYCYFVTGRSFPHVDKDCHRLAKDNNKGNGSYRYDQTNPAGRQPHYPPPPAVPTTGAEKEFVPFKQPNRVVALHVNHGKPTKAAETYTPYDNMYDTKPHLPYKKADVTYTACPTQDVTHTNAMKTKKPYIKYVKPDVIDLTEVNVNDMKEVIFSKVEDFDLNFNVDVDELSNEFNTETQLRNLDKSIKAIGTRLDTIHTTLFHGGGSNTHQANAINSMNGVVNAMSKVVAETYSKGEETHQHVLTVTATLNAARRESTKALNKLLSGSPERLPRHRLLRPSVRGDQIVL
jgi:hypothetical protein